MLDFRDDYGIGAHPDVMAAIARANETALPGYGLDPVSEAARDLIRTQIGRDADIHFVASGTLANLTMIAAALRPFEAAVAAEGGHINLHETGAVEATGHKVIGIQTVDGKLTPELLDPVIRFHTMPPHMARPRLVYISNAAETGRVYTKAELTALSEYCRAHNLYLMMDGARLAAAMAAKKNDLTLADIAELTDMFWMGGTKAGGLSGEAIVIVNPDLAADFAFHIKQRGALLSKGWFVAAQFDALLRSGLYTGLARHANDMALQIANALTDKGYDLADPTESNQVFPVLTQSQIDTLSTRVKFHVFEPFDESRFVTRLVTSWATPQADIDALLEIY